MVNDAGRNNRYASALKSFLFPPFFSQFCILQTESLVIRLLFSISLGLPMKWELVHHFESHFLVAFHELERQTEGYLKEWKKQRDWLTPHAFSGIHTYAILISSCIQIPKILTSKLEKEKWRRPYLFFSFFFFIYLRPRWHLFYEREKSLVFSFI